MARSPIASTRDVVPACGTQLRVVGQITVYPAGVRFPASVKVELAGVPKSQGSRQSSQVAKVPDIRTGFGAPAGGWVEPSRSPGRNASLAELNTSGSRVVTNVAGWPASIAARLNANGCGPRKAVPDELKTFMLM